MADKVAPFTGAWIEIGVAGISIGIGGVAPFTGAWIEIAVSKLQDMLPSLSHPSRVRGLKLDDIGWIQDVIVKSHPSRVRGLK